MTKQKQDPNEKQVPGTGRKGRDNHDLDEALDATFPASDPVTVGDETGDEPSHVAKERRAPLLDEELVKKLAREVKQTTEG
ncbi:MAG: hypothetical protein AB7L90_05315 [Hyphomicrobiaceae bacterium]